MLGTLKLMRRASQVTVQYININVHDLFKDTTFKVAAIAPILPGIPDYMIAHLILQKMILRPSEYK
jgi:hypothetical protein